MKTKLDRITEATKRDSRLRFTALAHLLTKEFLMDTWRRMNQRGSCGVDKETTEEFAEGLEHRCARLVAKLKARSYQAPPVRRLEIPKGDGKTRPLGIPTVEDRLVQRAVARILEAIYEPEFLNCSYGFRPGRSPHDALKELRRQFMVGHVSATFETDIRGFFNHLSHDWLMRMLRLRIGDPVILKLVSKWLKAGAMMNGIVVRTDEGTPQGGPISPILANIYLHYVLDLWFAKRVVPSVAGKAYLVRFADDFVANFEHRRDAIWFSGLIQKRMAQFNLELAEEKTRRIDFGRYAQRWPDRRPESFDFLGFRHVQSVTLAGKFTVVRVPTAKSCRKFLDKVKLWLNRNVHIPRRVQQKMLGRSLSGFYQYFGLHHCVKKLGWVRWQVSRAWLRCLQSQSQRSRACWSRTRDLDWFQLPRPTVLRGDV